jgi:hypothetical protein
MQPEAIGTVTSSGYRQPDVSLNNVQILNEPEVLWNGGTGAQSLGPIHTPKAKTWIQKAGTRPPKGSYIERDWGGHVLGTDKWASILGTYETPIVAALGVSKNNQEYCEMYEATLAGV